MNSPISIVIRSMDRPALKRALDSVSAQRLKPREIVVVAACGSRHGPLPAVDPAITARLVFPDAGLERLNRPQAGNTGLRATTQDWIGFLDDDDEYLPEHLETLFPAAQQFFQAGGLRGRLAYSLAQGIDRAGNATDLYGRSFSFVHIWDNTLVHTMNALFHRSLLAEGVVFDESLDILEDWDFWIQCTQRTAFAFVEKATTLWHGDEGDSGCGFGANAHDARYRDAQARVRDKWARVREATLARLGALRNDALAAQAAGNDDYAAQLSRQVLMLDPENADAANLLGTLSLRKGDYESARQLFEAAMRNAPPHFGLCLNMGLTEQARGNPDTAREWYLKGLALSPGQPQLLQRLAQVS